MAVDAAAAAVAGSGAATPLVFFLCACCATVTGLLLAAIDNGEVKDSGGYSPAAHVGACADSADALFAGLSADGGGLGFFEPLWKLFTPDGALWTLLTLGVSGLASAAGAIFSGVAGFATGGKDHHAKADQGAHLGPEKLDMTFLMELHAYWGYARLFAMGVVREYIIRVTALVWRDDVTRSYVNRERWNSGWVEFYKAHMYKLYVDCFNRPIANAPDSTFDVIERERPGGHFFGPLHDFRCTERVRTCINLGSYNYLGFGGVDRFCVPQARQAALEHGWSTGAPRSEGGTLQVHRDLEREVASFLSKEDALVLGMGFATNSTILPALFEAQAGGSGVLVLSDELNHRSIVEGVRLSGATVRAFAHNNMPELEAALQRAVTEGQPGAAGPWRKIFIVVEGIYSMEGDFCRLREIVTLKNRYKAYLYLDEAHSIGAVGPTGRGVSELLGVPTSEVDVMMGTFTKSFGSAGGYVAASQEVIAALRRNAPGCVFASAMSPPCAAQALAAFRVISGAEGGGVGAEKLASIRENANFFRRRLIEEGFKVLGDEDSPIVPVMLHHPQKMAWFSRQCLDKGIAVVVVGYPAVPVLYERVRFCLSAAHSRQQLAKVMTEIIAIGRNVGVLYERSTDKQTIASRAARATEYAAWLRSAPLVLSSAADVAEAARRWTPEPLALRAQVSDVIRDAALAAAVTVEDRAAAKGVEMRPFDPLGYIRRPLEAAQQATNATVDIYGFGACGPRGFYGSTRPHMDLEANLAKLLGTESAIAYSAGVATASSVLPALITPNDRVVVDSEVHLGVRMGLRLCKAHTRWVPHGDLQALEEVLKTGPVPAEKAAASKDVRPQRTFLIVEALCQRTGRIAELKEIVALKEKYGAFLILDESLSLGTLGGSGRGLFEAAGVEVSRIDALIGSLEHAVAGVGGYCAGRKGMIDHQRLAGAGYCFSASCPPAACSAASAVLADLSSEGGAQRAARLRENAAALHRELLAAAAPPLELISSPGSFVQHLRWRGDAAEGEARLSAIARACEAEAVRVQVCSPGACDAEAAFGARTGAPPAPRPTLRLCASAEHGAGDAAAAAAALRRALGA